MQDNKSGLQGKYNLCYVLEVRDNFDKTISTKYFQSGNELEEIVKDLRDTWQSGYRSILTFPDGTAFDMHDIPDKGLLSSMLYSTYVVSNATYVKIKLDNNVFFFLLKTDATHDVVQRFKEWKEEYIDVFNAAEFVQFYKGNVLLDIDTYSDDKNSDTHIVAVPSYVPEYTLDIFDVSTKFIKRVTFRLIDEYKAQYDSIRELVCSKAILQFPDSTVYEFSIAPTVKQIRDAITNTYYNSDTVYLLVVLGKLNFLYRLTVDNAHTVAQRYQEWIQEYPDVADHADYIKCYRGRIDISDQMDCNTNTVDSCVINDMTKSAYAKLLQNGLSTYVHQVRGATWTDRGLFNQAVVISAMWLQYVCTVNQFAFLDLRRPAGADSLLGAVEKMYTALTRADADPADILREIYITEKVDDQLYDTLVIDGESSLRSCMMLFIEKVKERIAVFTGADTTVTDTFRYRITLCDGAVQVSEWTVNKLKEYTALLNRLGEKAADCHTTCRILVTMPDGEEVIVDGIPDAYSIWRAIRAHYMDTHKSFLKIVLHSNETYLWKLPPDVQVPEACVTDWAREHKNVLHGIRLISYMWEDKCIGTVDDMSAFDL